MSMHAEKLTLESTRDGRMSRHGVSRRLFLASAGLAAAAAWGGSRLLGQPTPQPAPTVGVPGLVTRARKSAETATISVEKLRGNISVLIGVGGNIAVLHGKDGKLLVDSGVAGSQRQVREALAGVSADPVKHLVNTHWHFDHTDGNEWLHDAGATIIAHENVRKRLSESTRVELWDHTFPPAPSGALPGMTLRAPGGAAIHLNGTSVRLGTHEPAHTDGDTSVEFTDADVLHLGDLWWNRRFPFIDYGTGGSINGVIRAVEEVLSRVGAKTLIIPGHGDVGGKSELGEFRDMLAGVRDRVAALKKQGKTVEEVVGERPTAAYDELWGKFIFDGATFTRLVYAGV
jgi:glyoxylase-like metal-dependent hydrolase (beta-lactamase superfamily II)